MVGHAHIICTAMVLDMPYVFCLLPPFLQAREYDVLRLVVSLPLRRPCLRQKNSLSEVENILSLVGQSLPHQCWTLRVREEIKGALVNGTHNGDNIISCIQQCLLAPQTNIGTLDTTRVIERLTQARLSRFHSTGSAFVYQSGNIENLLSPSASRENQNLVLFFDRSVVDTKDYWAIIDQSRGRIRCRMFYEFVLWATQPTVLLQVNSSVELPIPVHSALSEFCDTDNVSGLMWEVNVETLVETKTTPARLQAILNEKLASEFNGLLCLCCLYEQTVRLYLLAPCLPSCHFEDVGPSPDLPSLLLLRSSQVIWYSCINILYGTSSSVSLDTKVPELSLKTQELVCAFLADHPDPRCDIEAMRCAMGRTKLNMDNVTSATSQRGRKKGTRRLARIAATHHIELHEAILTRLQWLRDTLYRVSSMHQEHRNTNLSFWLDLCDRVFDPSFGQSGSYDYPPEIHWLLAVTVAVVYDIQPRNARQENLEVLYNAIVWYVCRGQMSDLYLKLYLRRKLSQIQIMGVTGVHHVEMCLEGDEWFLQCKGGKLDDIMTGAFLCEPVLPIDRNRCTTTDHTEIHRLFGIEAVVGLFQNGTLAQSLGVCEASCNLLVDHIAHRGTWRGISRTSITHPGRTMDNTTIEDPTKHIRNSSFVGCTDTATTTSSSLLVGNAPACGTGRGFDIIYSPIV